MKSESLSAEEYNRPVAYDTEGRPLYAHPPSEAPIPTLSQAAVQQVVHVARAVDPIKQEVSLEMQKRHEESVKQYPSLNLSDGECVLLAVRRHPIGLVIPMIAGILLIAAALTILSGYSSIATSLNLTGSAAQMSSIAIPIILFCLLVIMGMIVTYYVYVSNKFFLTNESVIQEIQLSLFSKREQTVSLGNIEDASYRQHGILQQLLDYGSIRLSTEGDETTYRFSYVASPKKHIATLNNAVESFKNGRPVND